MRQADGKRVQLPLLTASHVYVQGYTRQKKGEDIGCFVSWLIIVVLCLLNVVRRGQRQGGKDMGRGRDGRACIGKMHHTNLAVKSRSTKDREREKRREMRRVRQLGE